MRYVVAVAEERSFTRAAKRCFVVQSALSHQIKALERELGVKLFARTSRRVELTAAGEAFLQSARTSIESADRAMDDAISVMGGQIHGTLTIGIIPTVTTMDIAEVVSDFHQVHPAVKIELRSGASDTFIASIMGGTMDVALLGLPETTAPMGVATRMLTRESLVAVVSSKHRLAGQNRITLADLADEKFVDFPTGTPGRAPSDLAFEKAGVRRDVPFEAMDVSLILELVRHDLVIALLSPAVVPKSQEFCSIPVVDSPVRIEYLAWSNFNPSLAAQAFLARSGRCRAESSHF